MHSAEIILFIICLQNKVDLFIKSADHTDERNAIDLKTGESFFVSDDTLVEYIKKYKIVINN